MKRYFTRFTLIFTAILCGLTAYMGLSLARNSPEWATLACAAALLWVLPVVRWSSEANETSRWELRIEQASFVSAGFLSWLFVITVIRDVIVLGSRAFAAPPVTAAVSADTSGARAFALAAVLTLLGAWRALRGPRIHEVTVPIEGLPAALDGLRIAQISDLHVGATIGRSYVERVVAKVRAIQPDLTVLTGDIADGNVADLVEAVAPLGELEPRGKVFYVPGNHEYYWNFDAWMSALARLGAQVLLNRGTAVELRGERIWIGGVTDPAAKGANERPPDVAAAAAGGESARLRILLSHRPDRVAEAERAGFQLQLSGHTHGGQFFPWTQVAKLFHHYFIGLMRRERMWIYVSPGTGTWGPPVRIGTTPEVSFIKINARK